MSFACPFLFTSLAIQQSNICVQLERWPHKVHVPYQCQNWKVTYHQAIHTPHMSFTWSGNTQLLTATLHLTEDVRYQRNLLQKRRDTDCNFWRHGSEFADRRPFSLLHKIMTLSGEPRLNTETSEARTKQPSPPALKTGYRQADDFAGSELWFTCNWCTCKLHHHGNEQELLSSAFQ